MKSRNSYSSTPKCYCYQTGTLTTNEMTVVSLVLFESEETVKELYVMGSSYSPIGFVDGILKGKEVQALPSGSVADIAAISSLCNDAKIIGHNVHSDDGEKQYERIGEPTEAALCILAEKIGGGISSTAQEPSSPSVLASAHVNGWRMKYERTATLEFNRDRKSMSVLCKHKEEDGNRLLVKGAPNLLLKRCTHIKYRDGTVEKLTGDLRRTIEAKISDLATRPLRCLALAVKETEHLDRSLKLHSANDAAREHPLLSDQSKFADIESGLTLVGKSVQIKSHPFFRMEAQPNHYFMIFDRCRWY